MNIASNYYGLSMEDWQKFAEEACYSLNQQIKSKAEKLFYDLTQSPDLNIIMGLISNGSDTLLFVLFSFFIKNPGPFGKDMQSVFGLIHRISEWQFATFTFVRSNSQALQKYVTRTIMACLGIFLKCLYENEGASREVAEQLGRVGSSYFKLYLLKSFVDAVEVVDYDMGYMKYRTMVYSFQDNVIPLVCDTLMPYFYNIEEGAQIIELSYLQEQLQVSDVETESSNSNQALITNEQELQSDYVFMLLQKIVEFNYNITYSEYESDQVIETCLITFPEKVSEKIINQEFLNALFFIIEKVSDVKKGSRKHEYLKISLSCIAKMMQSRMSYIDPLLKETYIYLAVKGLTHLLIKCQDIGSQALLEGILLCNKKLYMNCELSYIKTLCLKNNNSGDLYAAYLKDLTNMMVVVVRNSSIEVDNHLLLETLELATKVLNSYGCRDQDAPDGEDRFFIEFVGSIIAAFVDNLAQPKSIFQSYRIISIVESKPLVTQLFEYFKKIGSSNYQALFGAIEQKIALLRTHPPGTTLVFANLLYLAAELVDHNYLERNLHLDRASDQEYATLGRVVAQLTSLVTQYLSVKSSLRAEDHYTDTAVLIFMEALSIEFLNGFEFTSRFRIKQKLYGFMVNGEGCSELVEGEDDKSEEVVLGFLQILTSYLRFENVAEDCEMMVHYVLNAVEKCVFKLKWHMKRELYLKTQIFKFLSGFFENFFFSRNHLREVRSRVAKIVVTLTFDDILDEYKFRISKFLNILRSQPIELLHYDLIGVFEGIETHVISKYFYNRLRKELNLSAVVDSLCQAARSRHEEKSYKDFCRLIRCILNNKGFRISNGVIIYELFALLLPYLISLLKEINLRTSIDMDLWEPALLEIMEVLKGVVGGTHINIFLLQAHTTYNNKLSLIKEFLIEIMKTIYLLSPELESYPEMELVVVNICSELNKELLDYIFKDSETCINECYTLVHIKNIDVTIYYMNKLMRGTKVLEDKLVRSLDCLRYFFSYFNRKSKITHQLQHLKNLRAIYGNSEHFAECNTFQNKNKQLVEVLVNFLLSNHKNNYNFIKTITRLIYQLNQIFNDHFTQALFKLHLREEKLTEIKAILNKEVDGCEDSFVEKMKNWVREVDVFT